MTVIQIPLLPGECWWGGKVSDGQSMPYGETPISSDLSVTLDMNQGCPLLISNRGRYVWSEESFAFSLSNVRIACSSKVTAEVVNAAEVTESDLIKVQVTR